MNRVSFLIDGFNLYHSVRDAELDFNGASTKWLNIHGLCQSYIHHFGKDAKIEEIYYFSALAEHLEAYKPDVTARHRIFLRCLKETGIKINLNRFKRKKYQCPFCHKTIVKHEEKETDVTMALMIIRLFLEDRCDTLVLVTGDTDLIPAVKTSNHFFPERKIVFAFPYKRKNKELIQLCPGSFTINKKQYLNQQFPNPFITKSGEIINKPSSW